MLGLSRLLDFPPELVVGNPAAVLELLVSVREDGPQGPRTAGGELLGFHPVVDGDQERDRLPVVRDQHRLLATGRQVVVELSRDLRGRRGFRGDTSSPPTQRRFRSLTPTATTRTSRRAWSIW